MNEEEHYNDFDSSHYKFRGNEEFFLLGFSTPGFADVMANGGKEMLLEKYKDFYADSLPKIDVCDLTLAVNRSTIPKKMSIVQI